MNFPAGKWHSGHWKKAKGIVYLLSFAFVGLVATVAFTFALSNKGDKVSTQASGTTKLVVQSTNAVVNILDYSALNDQIQYPSPDPYYTGPPTAYNSTHLGAYGGVTNNGFKYEKLTDGLTVQLIAPRISQQDSRYGFTGWAGCTSVSNYYNVDDNNNWVPNSNHPTTPTAVVPDNFDEICNLTYSDDGATHTITAQYTTTRVYVKYDDSSIYTGGSRKILDKTVADQGSNSANPDDYTTPPSSNLGTYGGTANDTYSFQSPGKTINLIAPFQKVYTNGAYTSTKEFVRWNGCSGTEDNYDRTWAKTTNNGGFSTPAPTAQTWEYETCYINFPNNGGNFTVTAIYRDAGLYIETNLWDVPFLSLDVLGTSGYTTPDPQTYPSNYGTSALPNSLGGYGIRSDTFNSQHRATDAFLRYRQYRRTTSADNAAIVAPIQVTRVGQNFPLIGWTGCDTTYDFYDASWNRTSTLDPRGQLSTGSAAPDGIAETCIINYNNLTTSTEKTIRATYELRYIEVHRNVGLGGSVYTPILDLSVIGTSGFPSADPLQFPLNRPANQYGNMGGKISCFNSSCGGANEFYIRPTRGLANQGFVAPLSTGNNSEYGFRDWSGCSVTEDRYDKDWVLRTAFGGTSNAPADQAETCYVTMSLTGSPLSIYANYDTVPLTIISNLARVPVLDQAQVGQSGYSSFNPESYDNGQAYPYNYGDYSGPTLGVYGDRADTNYSNWANGYLIKYNELHPGINARIIYAPTFSANGFTYPVSSVTGCTALEDNYDASWNPGSDGTNDTCYINKSLTDPDVTIRIEYSITILNLGYNTDGSNSAPYGDDVRILQDNLVGTPGYSSANPNAYGNNTNYGSVGRRFAGDGNINIPTGGLTNTRIIAAHTKKNEESSVVNRRSGLIGWSGCTSTEDRYDADWNLRTAYGGTSNAPADVEETCVLNFPADGVTRTVRALYQYTSLFVRSNIPEVQTLNFYRIGQANSTNPNPEYYLQGYNYQYTGLAAGKTGNTIGSSGNQTNCRNDSIYYCYLTQTPGGYMYPGGPKILLVAPRLVAASPAFTFGSWSGCANTYDYFDNDWNPTTANPNGGTSPASSNPADQETCELDYPNDGSGDVFYADKFITMNYVGVTRIRVDSNTNTDTSASTKTRFLDLTAISPTLQGQIEQYATANLGQYGGIHENNVQTYQRDISGNTTGRIVAQYKGRKYVNYSYRPAYFTAWTGCSSVEDRFNEFGVMVQPYDPNGPATSDGVFETCYFNFTNDNNEHVLFANYDYSTLIVQSNKGGTKIMDYSVFGDSTHSNPDPNSYNSIGDLGLYGWSTYGDASFNCGSNQCNYTKYVGKLTNRKFVAPYRYTEDVRYTFKEWVGCDSVEDNWYVSVGGSNFGVWTPGQDGVFETCVLNRANDGSTITIQPNFKLTSLIILSNKVNTKFLDINALGQNANPNTHSNNALGTFGGIVNNYFNASYFQKQVFLEDTPSTSISTKIIAPLLSTTDSLYGFTSWTAGCTSVEDNYAVSPIDGSWAPGRDSVFETCVVNFSNDNLPHTIQADYVTNRVRVISNTFDTQFLDRIEVGTPGYSSPNPNTYNASITPLGEFGGSTTVPLSLNSYSYTKFTDIPSGSVIAPLTDTKTGLNFINWVNCPSPQDFYKADWTAGTDGIAETCIFAFANDGGLHSIEAHYGTLNATIGDQLFFDTNSNGVFENGEPVLANVEVSIWRDINENGLLDGIESLSKETQNTNSSGIYNFNVQQAGKFLVQVTDSGNLLTGYSATNGTLNTNNNSQGQGLKAVTLPSINQNIDYMDFGYTQSGSIGNLVFYDVNADGEFNAGDGRAANVTVNLYNDASGNGVYDSGFDTFVATQTTDNNGIYNFTGLQLTKNYVVVVDLTSPALLFHNSTHTSSTHTSTSDNMARNPQGFGVTLTLANPLNNLADFGFKPIPPSAIIGDTVFFDYNGNGQKNNGDTGIAGVEITLWQDLNNNQQLDASENTTAQTVTTDAFGIYHFNNLSIGDYILEVTDSGNILIGFTATQGTPNTNGNAQGSGKKYIHIPTPTTVLNYYDFGYTARGAIGNQVFEDSNNDGYFDANTESGIDSVTVLLYNDTNNNQVYDPGLDTLEQSQITTASGIYSFNNLIVDRSYIVRVNPASANLSGMLATDTPSSRNNPSDNYARNPASYPIILTRTARTNITADFGYYTPANNAVIGDTVFFDYNGNGIQDADDSGIENVEISLWKDTNGNGILDLAEESSVQHAITNVSGWYQFSNLATGSYLVQVTDANQVLTGTSATLGTTNTNNNSQGAGRIAVTLTTSGQIIGYMDFGYTAQGTVSGAVFNDTNNNAFADTSEDGITSVEIKLYEDTNNNAVFDPATDNYLESVFTQQNGTFQFTQLVLNKHYIAIPNPQSQSLVNKISTANAQSNINLSIGFAKYPSGSYAHLTRNNPTSNYHYFGYITPTPTILQHPEGYTSVRRIADDEVEWQLKLVNTLNTNITTIQANSPLPQNTSLVNDSIVCTTSQQSVIQLCQYNSADKSIRVEAQLARYTGSPITSTLYHPQPSWETPVFADTASSQDNSVVLTFRTKLNTVFREFSYQAGMYWDENGDLAITTSDPTFALNAARLSDDPLLPGEFDPTVYKLPLLPQTGMSFAWFILLAAELLVAAVSAHVLRHQLTTVHLHIYKIFKK